MTAVDTIIEQLLAHRSIRTYADEPVRDDDIERAVVAGQAASTSSAIQAYCLLRVRDAGKRRRLVELTGGQEKVADCGAFFVVCGDTRRHRLAVEAHGGAYDARLEAFLLAVIDATLFAQNFVVAVEAMGYGVCYIGGLRNRLFDVERLLAPPRGVYPLYGLCVGVPAETPAPRPRLHPGAILHDDAFPDDDAVRTHLREYDARYETYLRERGVDAARVRGWSSIMGEKFAAPMRVDLADYYTAKGANLG